MNAYAEFCRLFIYPTQWIFIWEFFLKYLVVSVIAGAVIGTLAVWTIRKKVKPPYSSRSLFALYTALCVWWWAAMLCNSGICVTITLFILLTGFCLYLQKSSQFRFPVKVIGGLLWIAIIAFQALLIGFLEGEKFYQERLQAQRQFQLLLYRRSQGADSDACRKSLKYYVESNGQSVWSNVADTDPKLNEMKRCYRSAEK